TLDRFDLTQVRPYLPPNLPASLESGTLGLALEVALERGENGLKRVAVSGDIRVADLALAQARRPASFLKLPRAAVTLHPPHLLTRSATLKSVGREGLELRAVRDQSGSVDLFALGGGSADAEAAPAPPPSKPDPTALTATAPAPFKVKLEKLT